MDALLTDLYQFTMVDAYLAEDLQPEATFELFVRRLPRERSYLVAAGLEQALDHLLSLRFSEEQLRWLAQSVGLHARTLQWLRDFRFTGDVDALQEGTPVFAEEPLLRVTAPLPQAQLVESRLLNLVHLQTLIASKAARVVAAAGGRRLVEFGMRRAHGGEAALLAARAAFLAGFDGSSNVEAGRRFGVPLFGTMAHSYVQAHASEADAFEAFVRARPARPVLLVDTYDTGRALAHVSALGAKLASRGLGLGGVRLDSGDLATLARQARAALDACGQRQATVFASGDLDEHRVAELVCAGAPIDGFGVGTALDTSADVPALEMVYKLQACGGRPRHKRSPGKATWPGARQVWREIGADGRLRRDVVTTATEEAPRPQSADDPARVVALLQPCMRGGRLLRPHPTLEALRAGHVRAREQLPDRLRTLEQPQPPYPVDVSARLRALAAGMEAEETRDRAGETPMSAHEPSTAPAAAIS